MIPTIYDCRKGKTMAIAKRSVVDRGPGEGEKVWTGGTQKTFRAVKLFCTMLLTVDTCVFIQLSKPIELNNTVNAKVKYDFS